MSQQRTEEFRRAAVEKFHSRGARSVQEVAGVLGVSSWSLYHWSKRYGNAEGMKKNRRPGDRSVQEKLKAVIEYEGLSGDKQGEYLRREGLHSDHIRAWKKNMEAGLETGGGVDGAGRSERAADKRKIKELEKELHRKDRALAETTALLVLKKKSGLDLGQRGERVSVSDRQSCMELVKQAQAGGAGRAASCQVLEVSLRTLERWEKAPDQGDQRRGPGTVCAHALSEAEKQAIVAVSNQSAYRDLSPWQIVAQLADQGRYLGSQSSFYRVLKQNDLLGHREKSKPRVHSRPKDLVARNPNEVWSWDITYLNSAIRGKYYYLYLVEDIFSRMIVGWTVQEVESAEHSAQLIERACQEHGILQGQLTLHADNGGPMTGATLRATLERLGVVPSFSRPAVSDDNPYSESLFKTLKYRPSYPDQAFGGIDQARAWVSQFVQWYNTEHLHSAIRFVTPRSRHVGLNRG